MTGRTVVSVRRRSAVVVAVGIAVAMLLACARWAPPADETLRAPPGTSSADPDLDALARDALTAARAAPDDVALQLDAAAALFQAANLRMQRAAVAWLAAHPEGDRAAVMAADDRIRDDIAQQVVSLCTDGLACAERAAEARPDDVRAQLHVGLHVSLLAWANGPARSLMAGYIGRMTAAIDRAIALDPTHDGGAPLRLQGRFRSKAPWPYGDLPAATKALQRAVEIAAVPVNHLFYGDALAAAGDVDAAEAQWRLAVDAPADESTKWVADSMREMARRRLAARR